MAFSVQPKPPGFNKTNTLKERESSRGKGRKAEVLSKILCVNSDNWKEHIADISFDEFSEWVNGVISSIPPPLMDVDGKWRSQSTSSELSPKEMQQELFLRERLMIQAYEKLQQALTVLDRKKRDIIHKALTVVRYYNELDVDIEEGHHEFHKNADFHRINREKKRLNGPLKEYRSDRKCVCDKLSLLSFVISKLEEVEGLQFSTVGTPSGDLLGRPNFRTPLETTDSKEKRGLNSDQPHEKDFGNTPSSEVLEAHDALCITKTGEPSIFSTFPEVGIPSSSDESDHEKLVTSMVMEERKASKLLRQRKLHALMSQTISIEEQLKLPRNPREIESRLRNELLLPFSARVLALNSAQDSTLYSDADSESSGVSAAGEEDNTQQPSQKMFSLHKESMPNDMSTVASDVAVLGQFTSWFVHQFLDPLAISELLSVVPTEHMVTTTCRLVFANDQSSEKLHCSFLDSKKEDVSTDMASLAPSLRGAVNIDIAQTAHRSRPDVSHVLLQAIREGRLDAFAQLVLSPSVSYMSLLNKKRTQAGLLRKSQVGASVSSPISIHDDSICDPDFFFYAALLSGQVDVLRKLVNDGFYHEESLLVLLFLNPNWKDGEFSTLQQKEFKRITHWLLRHRRDRKSIVYSGFGSPDPNDAANSGLNRERSVSFFSNSRRDDEKDKRNLDEAEVLLLLTETGGLSRSDASDAACLHAAYGYTCRRLEAFLEARLQCARHTEYLEVKETDMQISSGQDRSSQLIASMQRIGILQANSLLGISLPSIILPSASISSAMSPGFSIQQNLPLGGKSFMAPEGNNSQLNPAYVSFSRLLREGYLDSIPLTPLACEAVPFYTTPILKRVCSGEYKVLQKTPYPILIRGDTPIRIAAEIQKHLLRHIDTEKEPDQFSDGYTITPLLPPEKAIFYYEAHFSLEFLEENPLQQDDTPNSTIMVGWCDKHIADSADGCACKALAYPASHFYGVTLKVISRSQGSSGRSSNASGTMRANASTPSQTNEGSSTNKDEEESCFKCNDYTEEYLLSLDPTGSAESCNNEAVDGAHQALWKGKPTLIRLLVYSPKDGETKRIDSVQIVSQTDMLASSVNSNLDKNSSKTAAELGSSHEHSPRLSSTSWYQPSTLHGAGTGSLVLGVLLDIQTQEVHLVVNGCPIGCVFCFDEISHATTLHADTEDRDWFAASMFYPAIALHTPEPNGASLPIQASLKKDRSNFSLAECGSARKKGWTAKLVLESTHMLGNPSAALNQILEKDGIWLNSKPRKTLRSGTDSLSDSHLEPSPQFFSPERKFNEILYTLTRGRTEVFSQNNDDSNFSSTKDAEKARSSTTPVHVTNLFPREAILRQAVFPALSPSAHLVIPQSSLLYFQGVHHKRRSDEESDDDDDDEINILNTERPLTSNLIRPTDTKSTQRGIVIIPAPHLQSASNRFFQLSPLCAALSSRQEYMAFQIASHPLASFYSFKSDAIHLRQTAILASASLGYASVLKVLLERCPVHEILNLFNLRVQHTEVERLQKDHERENHMFLRKLETTRSSIPIPSFFFEPHSHSSHPNQHSYYSSVNSYYYYATNQKCNLNPSNIYSSHRAAYTPIHCALLGGNHAQCANILLSFLARTLRGSPNQSSIRNSFDPPKRKSFDPVGENLLKDAINTLTPAGESALLIATRYGENELVYRLLRYGANPTCFDRLTRANCLEIACSNRRTEIALALLKSEAYGSPTSSSSSKSLINHAGVATPLCWCSLHNLSELILPLMECGADPSIPLNGNSPLLLAVTFRSEEAALALIQFGAPNSKAVLKRKKNLADGESDAAPAISFEVDVNAEDPRTLYTPLHIACELGMKQVVHELLFSGNASLQSHCKTTLLTPLHIAILNKHEQTAIVVLEYAKDKLRRGQVVLDISAIDANGDTAVHMAARIGLIQVLEYLLIQFGAEEIIRLSKVWKASEQRKLPKPASLSATNRQGRTPLMEAIQAHQAEAAEVIISLTPETTEIGTVGVSGGGSVSTQGIEGGAHLSSLFAGAGGQVLDGTCLAATQAAKYGLSNVVFLLIQHSQYPTSLEFQQQFNEKYQEEHGVNEEELLASTRSPLGAGHGDFSASIRDKKRVLLPQGSPTHPPSNVSRVAARVSLCLPHTKKGTCLTASTRQDAKNNSLVSQKSKRALSSKVISSQPMKSASNLIKVAPRAHDERNRSSFVRMLLAQGKAALYPEKALSLLLRGFPLPELFLMIEDVAQESAIIGIQEARAMTFSEIMTGFLREHFDVIIPTSDIVSLCKSMLSYIKERLAVYGRRITSKTSVVHSTSIAQWETNNSWPGDATDGASASESADKEAKLIAPSEISSESSRPPSAERIELVAPKWWKKESKEALKARMTIVTGSDFGYDVIRCIRLYGRTNNGERAIEELAALAAQYRSRHTQANRSASSSKASEIISSAHGRETSAGDQTLFTESLFQYSVFGVSALQLAASLGLSRIISFLLRSFSLSPTYVPFQKLRNEGFWGSILDGDKMNCEVVGSYGADFGLRDQMGYTDKKWWCSPFRLAVRSMSADAVASILKVSSSVPTHKKADSREATPYRETIDVNMKEPFWVDPTQRTALQELVVMLQENEHTGGSGGGASRSFQPFASESGLMQRRSTSFASIGPLVMLIVKHLLRNGALASGVFDIQGKDVWLHAVESNKSHGRAISLLLNLGISFMGNPPLHLEPSDSGKSDGYTNPSSASRHLIKAATGDFALDRKGSEDASEVVFSSGMDAFDVELQNRKEELLAEWLREYRVHYNLQPQPNEIFGIIPLQTQSPSSRSSMHDVTSAIASTVAPFHISETEVETKNENEEPKSALPLERQFDGMDISALKRMYACNVIFSCAQHNPSYLVPFLQRYAHSLKSLEETSPKSNFFPESIAIHPVTGDTLLTAMLERTIEIILVSGSTEAAVKIGSHRRSRARESSSRSASSARILREQRRPYRQTPQGSHSQLSSARIPATRALLDAAVRLVSESRPDRQARGGGFEPAFSSKLIYHKRADGETALSLAASIGYLPLISLILTHRLDEKDHQVPATCKMGSSFKFIKQIHYNHLLAQNLSDPYTRNLLATRVYYGEKDRRTLEIILNHLKESQEAYMKFFAQVFSNIHPIPAIYLLLTNSDDVGNILNAAKAGDETAIKRPEALGLASQNSYSNLSSPEKSLSTTRDDAMIAANESCVELLVNAFWSDVLYAQFTGQLDSIIKGITAKYDTAPAALWNPLLRSFLPRAPALVIYILKKTALVCDRHWALERLSKVTTNNTTGKGKFDISLPLNETTGLQNSSFAPVTPKIPRYLESSGVSVSGEDMAVNNSFFTATSVNTSSPPVFQGHTQNSLAYFSESDYSFLFLLRGVISKGQGALLKANQPSISHLCKRSMWSAAAKKASTLLGTLCRTIAEASYQMEKLAKASSNSNQEATKGAVDAAFPKSQIRRTILGEALELSVRYDDVETFTDLMKMQSFGNATLENATEAKNAALSHNSLSKSGNISRGANLSDSSAKARRHSGLHLDRQVQKQLWRDVVNQLYVEFLALSSGSVKLLRHLYESCPEAAPFLHILKYDRVDARTGVPDGASREILGMLAKSSIPFNLQGSKASISKSETVKPGSRNGSATPRSKRVTVARAPTLIATIDPKSVDEKGKVAGSLFDIKPDPHKNDMSNGRNVSVSSTSAVGADSLSHSSPNGAIFNDVWTSLTSALKLTGEKNPLEEVNNNLNFATDLDGTQVFVDLLQGRRNFEGRVTWGLGFQQQTVAVPSHSGLRSDSNQLDRPLSGNSSSAKLNQPAAHPEKPKHSFSRASEDLTPPKASIPNSDLPASSAAPSNHNSSNKKDTHADVDGTSSTRHSQKRTKENSSAVKKSPQKVRQASSKIVDTKAKELHSVPSRSHFDSIEKPEWVVYLQSDWAMHSTLVLHSFSPSPASLETILFLLDRRAPLGVPTLQYFLRETLIRWIANKRSPKSKGFKGDSAFRLDGPVGAKSSRAMEQAEAARPLPLLYQTRTYGDTLLHILVMNDQVALARYFLAFSLFFFARFLKDAPTLEPGWFPARELQIIEEDSDYNENDEPSTVLGGIGRGVYSPKMASVKSDAEKESAFRRKEANKNRLKEVPRAFLRAMLICNNFDLSAFDYARSASMIELLQSYGCVPPSYRPNSLTFAREIGLSTYRINPPKLPFYFPVSSGMVVSHPLSSDERHVLTPPPSHLISTPTKLEKSTPSIESLHGSPKAINNWLSFSNPLRPISLEKSFQSSLCGFTKAAAPFRHSFIEMPQLLLATENFFLLQDGENANLINRVTGWLKTTLTNTTSSRKRGESRGNDPTFSGTLTLNSTKSSSLTQSALPTLSLRNNKLNDKSLMKNLLVTQNLAATKVLPILLYKDVSLLHLGLCACDDELVIRHGSPTPSTISEVLEIDRKGRSKKSLSGTLSLPSLNPSLVSTHTSPKSKRLSLALESRPQSQSNTNKLHLQELRRAAAGEKGKDSPMDTTMHATEDPEVTKYALSILPAPDKLPVILKNSVAQNDDCSGLNLDWYPPKKTVNEVDQIQAVLSPTKEKDGKNSKRSTLQNNSSASKIQRKSKANSTAANAIGGGRSKAGTRMLVPSTHRDLVSFLKKKSFVVYPLLLPVSSVSENNTDRESISLKNNKKIRKSVQKARPAVENPDDYYIDVEESTKVNEAAVMISLTPMLLARWAGVIPASLQASLWANFSNASRAESRGGKKAEQTARGGSKKATNEGHSASSKLSHFFMPQFIEVQNSVTAPKDQEAQPKSPSEIKKNSADLCHLTAPQFSIICAPASQPCDSSLTQQINIFLTSNMESNSASRTHTSDRSGCLVVPSMLLDKWLVSNSGGPQAQLSNDKKLIDLGAEIFPTSGTQQYLSPRQRRGKYRRIREMWMKVLQKTFRKSTSTKIMDDVQMSIAPEYDGNI